MRVAFVVERFPQLSETFVLGQIAGLIDGGHDVHIYADMGDFTGMVHPQVDRLHLRDRTHYGRHFPGARRVRQARMAVDVLKRIGAGTIRPAQLYRAVARSGSHAIPALNYDRVDEVYDGIVAHFGPNGVKALEMRRAGVFSGPILTVFHGYDMNARRHSVRRGYRGLLAEGDLFLPINEFFHRRLLEWGAPPGRVLVHHMGVDPVAFPLRSRRMTDGTLRVAS
ncbi:MAG: glycosyltransferase, partial [Gemmatimonadota bacterium]